jgi:hypothetical protein
MKIFILLLLPFFSSKVYSQDSLRINEINSIVNTITHSNYPTQLDSTFQDYPGMDLTFKTYIRVTSYGKELKKYSQIVKSTKKENQIIKEEVGGSAFYYDQNKLIKVEEFLTQEGKDNMFEWYFFDDQCFFHTLKSDKAEERIPLLLTISNTFLKRFSGQN